MELSEKYWNDRYENQEIGWDIGAASTPLVEYFNQIQDKNIKILIPGCGNAYEAEHLWNNGYKDVFLLDVSVKALNNFSERVADFPKSQLINEDFFAHQNEYDLILEQTFFCAIDPLLRPNYAQKAHELLSNNGKLIGLLFNREFQEGPPFGGNKEEYQTYFSPFFKSIKMSTCYNSIVPRNESELFINISDKLC